MTDSATPTTPPTTATGPAITGAKPWLARAWRSLSSAAAVNPSVSSLAKRDDLWMITRQDVVLALEGGQGAGQQGADVGGRQVRLAVLAADLRGPAAHDDALAALVKMCATAVSGIPVALAR